MSKSYFDMGHPYLDDEFGIQELPAPYGGAGRFVDLGWWGMVGWAKVAPHWRMTFQRPEDWADEHWEAFCREVEEDWAAVQEASDGDEARPE